MEDFDDLLAGLDRLENDLAHGLFLDLGDEILGDRKLDVGFQQGQADFAERGRDIFLTQLAMAAELFEDAFEIVGKLIEHGCGN